MKQNTHVVIMAGGIGSRLWPVSTPENPKQFIDLLGTGKSLIRMTFERFLPVCDISRFWVVTSGKYAGKVREQLPDIPEDHILSEPEPRNTAPCIAYACRKISVKNPDANIVVTPSDAIVLNKEKFIDVIDKALDFTSDSSSIVTIGIKPDRPETGYGYIKAGGDVSTGVMKVSEFKEKPDVRTARKYLADGNYYWNAGIFVWNVRTIMSELGKYAPGISKVMDRLEPYLYSDREAVALKELFPLCDKISIDYAVMEKSTDIYVIAGDLEWSDLGSWAPMMKYIPAAGDGNRIVGGDVRMYDCRNCIVHASNENVVIVEGLEGYIVAHNNGNLLVCRLSDEQRIKDFSQNKSK
ncbi:MAG: mannose-1-phosphate guanylyltransferase [Bacteroidales bacterium]|jgi:mannose-1-phosphate guanylyltransferase|nr:mannose-1-phosphate guanylyltransferase [Bacteroidales bacterium]MCI1785039.1 mannose-1-phosphate guanylyltransferase [Bacteroidales bacterium]